MARARNIKPGFFENEDLAECSAFARLCFAGLWTLADREGRLEDRPKRIKGDLFAFDSIEVEPLLRELVKWKFITRYVVGDQALIQILKFSDHQTPHFKEVPSKLPPPSNPGLDHHSMTPKPETLPPLNEPETQGKTEARPRLNGHSRGGQNPLIPDSGFRIPDSGYPLPPNAPNASARRFAEFWAVWPTSPRKVGKAECEKRWRARKLDTESDAILAHVSALRMTDQWQRGFEPAPLTYLNQRRWEDGAIDASDLAVEQVNRV